MDADEFDLAVEKWQKAIDLIPEPKTDWEAYMWLSASIGDALYQKKLYEIASANFINALNAPGGIENPFVHFRLGQCQTKLGNERLGLDHLLKAYMLDGEDIFLMEADGIFSLELLKNRGLVN